MKKLLIALIGVVLIAGATVSVLKWLEIGPFADPNAPSEEEQVVEEEPARYIDMEPLVLSIFADDRVATVIQIELQLETDTPENQALIERRMPRIKDAFVKEMHAFIPRLLRRMKRLDILAVRDRLQLVANRQLGEGVVTGVLIQSIDERKG
ncbi:MAG: flagellar basal body-associated FliL family protein [Magnetovibrionaceae bacterium]